ncbi:MAG: helix-hairpin-helix domain-containing protein [Prevotellaceae bacterium]|nr:helix-hairpin-helix domain-containing protein [Prevotellaceae bacterium]
MRTRKLTIYILLLYLLVTSPAFCQTKRNASGLSWEDFVERIMNEGDEEEAMDDVLIEHLYEIHCNPLDINTLRKDDLEELPFLSEEQIEDIMKYLEKYRPVKSLGELLFISSLGKGTRDILRLFVEVQEKTANAEYRDNTNFINLLKNGQNEAVWRSDIPFYKKAGYEEYPADVLEKSPNKVYRGDRLYHSLRYSFSSMNHLLAGVNMEKDAGERGVDYVSGYVMLKDMGIVKRAVIGNYRLNFGKGLAVNSSAMFGKTMMLSSQTRMGVGITQHSSTMESGYFTGGAATVKFGNVEISAFGSYRRNDGTYNNDSTGMSSLKTDGLHRTQLEHSKKGNLGTTDFGGNIQWEYRGIQLSATAIATHLSVPLLPMHNTKGTLYRYYNAHGQDFFVGSIAYAYRYKSISFSGETAVSNCEEQSGTATLNTLQWRVDGHNTLSLIGRYYGAKFVSLNGKAFGDNSSVQNEEGVFLGWMSRSIKNTTIEAYIDAMYFPWFKSQVSSSSHGFEGMMQATYYPNNQWNALIRYRIKSKQKDFTYTYDDNDHTVLQYKTNHNLKMQLNYNISSRLTLRTSAIGTISAFSITPAEYGFAISENIRWQNPNTKLRIDLGLTYFNTDSYDAQIYNYEPSLLYTFSSTSYYYHGIRTTLLASIPIVKQSLFVNTKVGFTRYFNRNTIGSGLELINANHKEDLQIQVRWKF